MKAASIILLLCLQTMCLAYLDADFDSDGIVNFSDFVVFSDQWLKEESEEPGPIRLKNYYVYGCNSVSYLDGHEYPPNVPRLIDIAFANISDGRFEAAEYDGLDLIVITKCGQDKFYAVRSDNFRNIYKSTDGFTWTLVRTTDFTIRQLWGLRDGTLLMAKHPFHDWPPKIYRSTDEGVTWSEVLTYSEGANVINWSIKQAPHGTIIAVEYSYPPDKGRNIYRSVDGGATWTTVYTETGDITHIHLATYHAVTTDWFAQCGDNEPRRKMLKSTDDGLTWQVWAPYDIGKEFFNVTQLIDYGDPTQLFFGDDASSMLGFLDVTNGYVKQTYSDHVQRAGRHLIFAAFYYNGVFYAGVYDQNASGNEPTLLASEDGENWVVYHRFVRPVDGENFKGIREFVGVGSGKLHCRMEVGTTGHFTISPANIQKLRALLLEPGTTNLLDTPEKSSIEEDGTGMEVVKEGVSGAMSFSQYSHGSASYNVTGPASVENYGRNIISTAGIPTEPNSVYWGSFKIKGASLFQVMPRWKIGGEYICSYPDIVTMCATAGHSWTTCYLPPYMAPPDAGEYLKLSVFVFGKSNCPYDVYVDDLQVVKDETPSSWQFGGTPRSDTTYNCTVSLPAAWTNVFYVFPEFYHKNLEGAGQLFIRAWMKDADNFAELYFDSADKKFKFRSTVDGVTQIPVESGAHTFQRKALIRFALRCSSEGLTLSIVNGRSEAEHLVDNAFPALCSNDITIKYGDKDGFNGFPLFLAVDSDFLYESAENDSITMARMSMP